MDSKWLNAWSEWAHSYKVPEEDDACIQQAEGTTENPSSEQLAPEEDSGPAAPGPISTFGLLSSDGKTPLPDLKAKIDYRGVPPIVYFIFLELHGKDSSPEICRYLVDIYKAAVPEDKLVKIKLLALVSLCR